MNSLISVIVPVYNGEKYIRCCIESIINQSYRDIELLLINDGSSDRSGEICNDYAFRDKRIRVIHTQNNGPAQARNNGIENSKGDFIFFVDSDDSIENNAIDLLIKNYEQTKADIIVGDFNKIRDGKSDYGRKVSFSDSTLLTRQDIIDHTLRYLKKPNRHSLFVYVWGRLYKSAIIKDNGVFFNTDLHTFEDLSFNFRYLKFASSVYFVKKPIYNYYIHDNYMSATMMVSDNLKIWFEHKRALPNISEFLKNCNSHVDIEKEVGHAFVCLTIIQLVRTCGWINGSNKEKIYELIHEIINDSDLRGSLKFYSPSNGDSRILPILMKLRLVWPIILVCRYKAYKRYGERGAVR